jgi:hypothetical protein
MSILKLKSVGAMVVLACLTTRSATAVDAKVLPASACRYLTDFGLGYFAEVAATGETFGMVWDGTLYRELPPGHNVVVSCPIVRDVTSSAILSVHARIKRGSGLAPDCTLYSVSPTNGAVASKRALMPPAVATGTVHNLVINAAGLTQFSGGSYNLACVLYGTHPGLNSPDKLLSYYWEEL